MSSGYTYSPGSPFCVPPQIVTNPRGRGAIDDTNEFCASSLIMGFEAAEFLTHF